MRRVVNDAMDILGGAGICLGPRNVMGRSYQSLPISITVEGANILTRTMIIFGQGAVRSHPFIFQELEAVSETDPEKALEKFDRALFGHIHFFIKNLARCMVHGLTGSRLAWVPGRGRVRRYYQHLTRMSAAFALMSDVAILTLGASLKRREKLSGRLADIFSQLYLASAALKRFADQGSPKEDLPLLCWVCDQCLYVIQDKLNGLLTNLPYRPISWVLSWFLFPLGRRFSPPSDKLGTQIAELLLSPSATRDRLTDGLYIPDDINTPVGRTEDALVKVIQAEHVERKIRKELKGYDPGFQGLDAMISMAVEKGIISKEDAELLKDAEAARREVIKVDDFPIDFGKEP